jgi:hypothetical protein
MQTNGPIDPKDLRETLDLILERWAYQEAQESVEEDAGDGEGPEGWMERTIRFQGRLGAGARGPRALALPGGIR